MLNRHMTAPAVALVLLAFSATVYASQDVGPRQRLNNHSQGMVFGRRSLIQSEVMPSGIGEASLNGGIFYSYVVYSAGGPGGVAVGDFNSDGLNDVATCNGVTLRVLPQNSYGTLDPPILYQAGNNSHSCAMGDFNHDGRDDVVTANQYSASISIFLQRPNGTFAPRVNYSTAPAPNTIAVGDLNNDGWDDVVTAHSSDATIRAFYQQADGSFQSMSYPSNDAGYDDIDVGDLNHDGRTDVVKLNGQGLEPDLLVYPQNGGGTLDGPVPYPYKKAGHGVATGDVTGDGRADVVMTYGGNQPWSKLAIFAQTSTGTLKVAARYDAYDCPEPVETADINMDGLLDVLVVHAGWLKLGVFLQQPNGILAPYQLYSIPDASFYDSQGLDVGDINNDGAPDAVIGDYNHGLVVLYNALPTFRVDVSDENPVVAPGDTITETVTLSPHNGFTQTVSLTVEGLPPGATYSVSSNPIVPPAQVAIRIAVKPTVPLGVYPVRIRGTGGMVTQAAEIELDVADTPILGLTAVNSGPVPIGTPATLTATITAGSNVSYIWDLDGVTLSAGAVISHTYLVAGDHSAIVTAVNSSGVATAATTVSVTVNDEWPRGQIRSPSVSDTVTVGPFTSMVGTNTDFRVGASSEFLGAGYVPSQAPGAAGATGRANARPLWVAQYGPWPRLSRLLP